MVHSVWGWGSVGGPAHIHGVCRASRLRGQLAVGVMARRVGVPERIGVLGSLHCAARRALERKCRLSSVEQSRSFLCAALERVQTRAR